jgi:hypothetical protein
MIASPATSSCVLRGTGIGVIVRLDYILFPIKFEAFREALASNGFSIIVPRAPNLPIGADIAVTGPIARKQDVVISLDSERQVLSAEGKSLADTLSVFSEIEKIVEKVLRIDVTSKARFYEVLANYEAETGKNPLQQISNIGLPKRIVEGFEEILGAPVSSYTLRLSPTGQVPNQEDWFDIRIEPLVIRATDTYLVNVMYRNKEKSKLVEFTSHIEEKIKSMLNMIET